MRPLEKYVSRNSRGTVMIVSMILLVIVSSLALSIAAMSGTNVQLAENLHKSNQARASAESGFDIIHYWLSRLLISGSVNPEERLSYIASSLQDVLEYDCITNMTVSFDGSSITIPAVILDSSTCESFSAVITMADSETLKVDVIGSCSQMTKTISANYTFKTCGHPVFDYGVATKGSLSLSGNVDLDGVNVSVEASVFIESENSNLALSIIGNSQIAGNVNIVNPAASVYLQGQNAGIGGETGQDAVDNHVSFGVLPTNFPEPNPGLFEQYIVTEMDSNTDTSSDVTLENVRIPANTNPVFSGHTTLQGIVFVESPNVVEFTGDADITGIIVGNGDISDNSGDNRIIFTGNVESHPVNELPSETQFDEMRDQTGTFVMAPGFSISFGGSFDTICGVISGNGIDFYGNAGGIINGTVINYSGDEMTLSGNSDLCFNHSGITEAPAGFIPEFTITYNPASYTEITQ